MRCENKPPNLDINVRVDASNRLAPEMDRRVLGRLKRY